MDRKFDNKLLINTRGIREWDSSTPYHRCESTPYLALEELFNHYKLEDNHRLVDFGSGRGRVIFYIHNKFNIPVTGIELHQTTINEALANKLKYEANNKSLTSPINFEKTYAETYEIKKEDNLFYFFNPFKPQIFRKVVDNIIESAEKYRKVVDIILYYPMPGYKKYLNFKTDFQITHQIFLENVDDSRERFIIYRLDMTKLSK